MCLLITNICTARHIALKNVFSGISTRFMYYICWYNCDGICKSISFWEFRLLHHCVLSSCLKLCSVNSCTANVFQVIRLAREVLYHIAGNFWGRNFWGYISLIDLWIKFQGSTRLLLYYDDILRCKNSKIYCPKNILLYGMYEFSVHSYKD